MEKRPSSFGFKNKTFKAEFNWTVSFAQRPPKYIFACSKQESHKSFILAKHEGLSICEDFLNNSLLCELQTENLQLQCVDYSWYTEQLVVMGFSTGHILLMDPTKRKRGKVTWLNTRKNIYSLRPPKVCRWVNEHQYIVLFGDSYLWRFDKRLEGEDTDFIRAAPTTAKDSSEPILYFNHPSPKANPVSFWKLNLGSIRDVQVCPRTRGSFLAIITDEDLKIVDLANSTLIVTLKSYFAGFQSLAWSADGGMVVCGGEDDCIHVWSSFSWKLIGKCVGHSSWISSLCCFVRDGAHYVASAGHDGRMIIWEIEEKEVGKESNREVNKVGKEEGEEKGGGRENGVFEYPKKGNWEIIEPCVEVKVSEEPLQTVAVHDSNFFVLDMVGNLNMWGSD